MKRIFLVLVVLVPALAITGCAPQDEGLGFSRSDVTIQPELKIRWNFDRNEVNSLPSGFKPLSGHWSVRAVDGSPSKPNALCQTAESVYPTVTLRDELYDDIELITRFKTVSGMKDQAAGLIFRVQDKANYYILRANASEDNVNLYKYVAEKRTLLVSHAIEVPDHEWHELKVDARSTQIRGYFDDKLLFEVTDNTFAAGKAGLWTKADTTACFDNVVLESEEALR